MSVSGGRRGGTRRPVDGATASELGRFVHCQRAWYYDQFGAPRPEGDLETSKDAGARAAMASMLTRGRQAHADGARADTWRHRTAVLAALTLLALALLVAAFRVWS